jgi:formamidopyrimidine-DNA glycosylase
MPELPEVETVRRTLGPHLLGRTIVGVEVGAYLPVIGTHAPDELAALLIGRVVARLNRRGKYLLVDFDDRSGLIVHLRMTGALTVVERGEPALRFEQLRLLLDDGRDLRFTDQRKFGRVTYRPASDPRPLESKLGP